MEDKDDNKAAMAEALAKETPEGNTTLADIEKEIDAAVEKVHVEGEKKPGDEATDEPAEDDAEGVERTDSTEEAPEEPEAETEEAPEEKPAEEPEGSQGRDAEGKFTRKAPFSDALLERALKAGLSLAEAREFPNEKLLSATVGRLESVQKGDAKPGEPKGKDGEAKPAQDDPVAAIDAIPDLNPEVYEKELVTAFGALKGIAKTQAKELVELRGKGSKDFMATQLEGVKEFTKGDQSKETAVREKFDTLKAGYKATGKDVSDVTVFAEAAQLVLGGDMKAKAEKNKAEAATRRNGQRISRAAGQRVAAKADPIQQTGDEIQAAFFD